MNNMCEKNFEGKILSSPSDNEDDINEETIVDNDVKTDVDDAIRHGEDIVSNIEAVIPAPIAEVLTVKETGIALSDVFKPAILNTTP